MKTADELRKQYNILTASEKANALVEKIIKDLEQRLEIAPSANIYVKSRELVADNVAQEKLKKLGYILTSEYDLHFANQLEVIKVSLN